MAEFAFNTLMVFGAVGSCWAALRLYFHRWRPMRIVTVIDGDTFMGVGQNGKRLKLRLQKVDCPELDQRNGQAAKDFVAELMLKQWVQVRLNGCDRYHRHLCDVRVRNQDLALLLVRAGMAYALTRGLRLRMAQMGAALRGRGVHRGFGQPKPWEAASRNSMFSRLARLLRPFRKRS